jgi:thiamine monophosphate kinase
MVCYLKERLLRPQQGAWRLATLAVSDVTNAGGRNMLLIAAIETTPRAKAFTWMQRLRGGSPLAVVGELCRALLILSGHWISIHGC